jgi:hypothetical protein
MLNPARRRAITAPSPPLAVEGVQSIVFRRSVGLLLLFLLLDLVVLGQFLFTSGLPLHGDLAFPLTLERYRADVYPLWNSFGSLSNLEDVDRLLVTLPLVDLAQVLGLTMGGFVKSITLGTLLLSQVAMFAWVRMLLSDEVFTKRHFSRADVDVAAATAAIFFGFSPWVMPRMSAWFFWLTYAITPLALLALTWALRDRKPLALIATALIWSIGSGSPQFTLFLGIVMLGWALFLVLTQIASGRYTAKALLGLLGLYTLINAYWMWPIFRSWFVQAVTPGYILSTADVDMLSRNATPMNVLLGRDEWLQWWSPSLHSGDGLAIWNFAAVSLLAFCCLGAVVARNRAVPFVLGVLIVSFFAAQGSNGPLGRLYSWLVFDAPGAGSWGWLIRASEKFGGFLWFAFATLLAFSTVWLLTKLRETGRPPWAGAAIVLSVALFVTLPKLVAGTWGPYVPVDVPPAYTAANQWLEQRGSQQKALWLGRYETGADSIGYAEHTWAPGRYAGYVFARSSGVPAYGGYHYTNPFAQYRAFLLQNLNSPALWKLLAAQGIGYVVYQNDIRGGEAAARADLANLRRTLKPVFNRGPLTIFRNNRAAPRVTAPSGLVVMHGGMRGMRHLAETTTLDPRRATVVFRDQHRQLPDLRPFNALTVSYDVSPQDLQVDRALASRGSVVWPFDLITNGHADQGWARLSISHQFDGDWPWHKYVRSWLLGLDRWELDRGRGIVLNRAENARMSLPLRVPQDGRYDVYVRLFRHPHGGRISVLANGQPLAALNTSGPEQSFGWELVGSPRLGRGRNVVRVVGHGGHTAIAAVGVVPTGFRGSAPPLSTFVGETTRANSSNLAKLVVPSGRNPSLKVSAGRTRTGPVQVRLLPGGGEYAGRWNGQAFQPRDRVSPRGEYFALVGTGMRPLLGIKSSRWTPQTNERAVRSVGGALTARVRPGVRRPQVWRSEQVALGRSETDTRFLAAEISATSVRNFQMKVVWRRNGRITRMDDVSAPQTGAFRRLIATVLRPPERTETMQLRIVAGKMAGGPSSWRLRRLEVASVGRLAPYSTVLVGGNALERALSRSRENAVYEPTDTPAGPIDIELKRPSVVRLAESYDAYWTGEARGGVDGRQLVAYGSVNAFAVPVGKTPVEIAYAPQRWTEQAALVSIATIGLLGVGLFVRTRRRLNATSAGAPVQRRLTGRRRDE